MARFRLSGRDNVLQEISTHCQREGARVKFGYNTTKSAENLIYEFYKTYTVYNKTGCKENQSFEKLQQVQTSLTVFLTCMSSQNFLKSL